MIAVFLSISDHRPLFNYIYYKTIVVWRLHSSEPPPLTPLPLFNGGSKFWLPPPGEGGQSGKLKKGGGSMVQGQVLLIGGADTFPFNFFKLITFKFRNYFTLCKIILCIWRQNIFFCHHNFMKKVILKIFHKLRSPICNGI